MSSTGLVVLMAFEGIVELSTLFYFVHFGLLDYHTYSDFIRRKDRWNRHMQGIEDNIENYQWLATAGVVICSQFLVPQFLSIIQDDPPALSKALGLQNIVLWLCLTFCLWLTLLPEDVLFVAGAALVSGGLAIRGGQKNASKSRAIALVLYVGLTVMLTFGRTYTKRKIWNSFQGLSILLSLFLAHGTYLMASAVMGSTEAAVVSMHSATVGFVMAIVYGYFELINRDIAIKLGCVWSWYAFLIYILKPSEKKRKD